MLLFRRARVKALALELAAVEGFSSRIILVKIGRGSHCSFQHPNCMAMLQWCKFYLSTSTSNYIQGLHQVGGQLLLSEKADSRFLQHDTQTDSL